MKVWRLAICNSYHLIWICGSDSDIYILCGRRRPEDRGVNSILRDLQGGQILLWPLYVVVPYTWFFFASGGCGSNDMQRLIPTCNLGNNPFACFIIISSLKSSPVFQGKWPLRWIPSKPHPSHSTYTNAWKHSTNNFWHTCSERFSPEPPWLWVISQACSRRDRKRVATSFYNNKTTNTSPSILHLTSSLSPSGYLSSWHDSWVNIKITVPVLSWQHVKWSSA